MVERPRKPDLVLEDLEDGDENALVLERTHDRVAFGGVDLTGEKLFDRELVECTVSGARLDDANKFPVAAANNLGHITNADDRITPKLAALEFYQLAIRAPAPPANSFDAAAAARGKVVFDGKGDCARCHSQGLYTDPGWNMHTGAEIGIDDFQADRSPDGRYRTAPLAGLWTHTKGGFYHDGRFATLGDVVDHYDTTFTLGLTDAEKADLVEYLKSL